MDKTDIKKIAKSSLTGDEIVSSHTDPDFYSALEVMPNPDAILRKIGKADEVYQSIRQDPHVIGEIRLSRAGLLKFETKITAGGESAADMKALELCREVMTLKPAKNMVWSDVLWNMSEAQYFGFVVHEIIWEQRKRYILPAQLLDRKNSRFQFSASGELLVKIKGKNKPQPIDENRILLTRHMPSAKNPYGLALFSSCFWAYTFKHSGFRSYTKFINKYGMPWVIAKYPQGTSNKEIDNLVLSLQQMVEDAVAAIPDGSAVDLIEVKSSNSVQETFINMCNREMSKALTSQTMATEQSNNGSRAAGIVAREREESVDTSQRVIVEATINKLFSLITEINIAGAKPPTFNFYEQDKAPQNWIETLEKATGFMDVSKEYAHKVTGIPSPKDENDKLQSNKQTAEFSKANNPFHQAQENQLNNIYSLLSNSDNLTEFNKKLVETKLNDDIDKSLIYSMLNELVKGRSSV